MDPFIQDILAKLLQMVSSKFADEIRVLCPNVTFLQNKEDIDTRIEAIFNPGFQLRQFQALEYFITDNFNRLNEENKQGKIQSLVYEKYDQIQQCLDKVQEKYNAFIANPDSHNDFTWNEFVTFMKQPETDPLSLLKELDKWIMEKALQKNKLADDLVTICQENPVLYQRWQEGICLTFARGYLYRLVYHYYTIFEGEKATAAENDPAGGISETVHQQLIAKATADHKFDYIMREIRMMKLSTTNVVEVLKEKLEMLRLTFLLKKCGPGLDADNCKAENHCGAENRQNCSELTAKVYNILRDSRSNLNSKIAENIAKYFRENYEEFVWSVVVVDNQQQSDLLPNSDKMKKIWLQKFGTKSLPGIRNIMTDSVRENTVLSDHYGPYGYLLCYYERKLAEKAAIVLWADRKLIGTPETVDERKRLKRMLEGNRMFCSQARQTGPGSIFRTMGLLRDLDLNFLFGLGIHKKQRDKEFGVELGNDEHGTFPLQFGAEESFILTWPERPIEQVNECNLVSVKGKELSSSSIGRVYIGHMEGEHVGAECVAVVVKEVFLSSKKKVYRKQINQLHGLLRPLKRLDHPNIVYHLACQAFIPAKGSMDFINRPTYQLIMNYYQGGTLANFVKNPVTLSNIAKWSTDILNGLAYLHERDISHRAIYGDHLVFQGPQPGAGDIRLISLERKFAQIEENKRSYVQPDNNSITMRSFQPTEMIISGKVGSKTDIYSFGCVLIQIITGAAPVLSLVNGKNRPVISDWKLPSGLQDILNRCLVEEYEQRPTALALLELGDFQNMADTNDWNCPARN